MHVGHFRSAVLGDSLAKLFRYIGYEVEVNNYIDDTGAQVADTVNGLLTTKLQQSDYKSYDYFAWNIYR